MPIRKFRSVEEIEDVWYEPGDPDLARAIRSVWNFAARTCPQRLPPGVHRYRSFAEASAQRERWEDATAELR